MFEIPVGARHLLIQETDATSHNLGKYNKEEKNQSEYFFSAVYFCLWSLTMCLCICLPIILPHHIPPSSMLY